MAEAQAPEKVLDLIRKLLALSTSSNENEAALAASKAQALLLKYNLEMSQIHQEAGDEVERWDFQTPYMDSWLGVLINSVATANLCHVVGGKGYKEGERVGNIFRPGKEVKEFYLFGKKPNLEVVEFMYAYLAGEIDRLTPKKMKAKWIASFRLGAVAVVSKRLREELSNFQSTSETTALVVASDKAVSTRVIRDFPHLRQGRKTKAADYGAFIDGQAAGKSIQFRQGVAANSNAAGQGLLS
jgi:hypothetical protein